MQNKVLLVSPYNQNKVGGIGTWSKSILDFSIKNSDNIYFLNTALGLKSNIQNSKTKRLVFGLIDSVLILIILFSKLIIYRPHVVHYTSSASFALYKDYCAILMSKLFCSKFIIHFRFGRIPELQKNKNREWRMLCRVINMADKVIVIDNESFKCLINEGYSNIANIPNPISYDLQKTSLKIQNKPINKSIGTVVFVGHVIINKGVFELVKACTQSEEVKKLIVIGPYHLDVKNNLIKIAEKKNNGEWLTFLGEIKREEALKFIGDANLLALPSYTEGFPNVVLEAMALSCPVVATNVGAIKEMIDFDKKNASGLLVKTKDCIDLREKIDYIINNKIIADNMGKNGLNKVLNFYTIESVYSKLRTIWES